MENGHFVETLKKQKTEVEKKVVQYDDEKTVTKKPAVRRPKLGGAKNQ